MISEIQCLIHSVRACPSLIALPASKLEMNRPTPTTPYPGPVLRPCTQLWQRMRHAKASVSTEETGASSKQHTFLSLARARALSLARDGSLSCHDDGSRGQERMNHKDKLILF